MSSNVINQVPFLRTSREFPNEIDQLSVTLDETYIETASAINNRTIGLHPTNRPAIGGESWFFDKNQRQQNLRKVYIFTAVGTFPHGLTWDSVNRMTKCFGSYTDVLGYQYGAIFANSTAIVGQITFYVTDTSIIILPGTIVPTEITIVLDWLSDV